MSCSIFYVKVQVRAKDGVTIDFKLYPLGLLASVDNSPGESLIFKGSQGNKETLDATCSDQTRIALISLGQWAGPQVQPEERAVVSYEGK